ncbi:MAG TPA: T9SS type A sorting domain-containing protein [Hymenobacter sp.]|uniref:T9SS type A sorting domain-containing protein n=1 Tax=Hymenobacter sp. TaxID=1898978 RepID=UPI002D7FA0DE|nr:T9SS type A sorting domain-containing protein [Hymenobacter sp.]HET9502582.1 T9SS type A sorting domain-containing protein [Hymenobacter sp.]
MKLLLRFLALPALLPFAAAAQLVTGPLPADPARAATAAPAANPTQRTTALTLPFFEDFTSPLEGTPNATRWQAATTAYPNLGATIHYAGGGAYVSNRLAVEPLTRGTATLDGLRANGLPYVSNLPVSYGQIDTLTSQVIDLSGFTANSNVRLSFAWQAGGVVGAPTNSANSSPTNLTLELLDNSGIWQSAWTYTSRGSSTKFKQQIFALSSAYLHSAFRFRFRASGSRTQNTDVFGLDYIYLNNNRAANDTTFQDIATSRGLSSPLAPYTSLPVWQYNAATTAPLSTSLTATVNSLTNTGQTPTPISWQGTVRDLGSSGFSATWLTGGRPIVAAARQEVITGSAATAPLPNSPATKRLRYRLALTTNETNPLTLPNDTLSRDVELANYYAYDDGTPEFIVGLAASSTNPFSYVALAFTTNQADYVRAVQVLPIFNNTTVANGGENNQPRPITVAVWADNNGKPANTPLATATATLANSPTAGPAFQTIPFTTPVPVSGRFYIGYGQASTGQFLNYGLDLNNQLPANTLFSNTLGAASSDPWRAVTLGTPGAPLLRAVMNQTSLATRGQQAISAAFALYPNPAPASTAVLVEGPAFRQATLLDVLGRPVWQQPAAEAGQPTLRLPARLPGGVYLVQLALPDGSTATRRLVLE